MEATTTERRADDAPADRRKLDPIMRAVALAIVLAFLAWAAKPLVPVTAARFETDSIARDKALARRDSILDRVDARVGAIYCASLPSDRQAGCR